MPHTQRPPISPAIVVVGAGGRAGRAVAAAGIRRGHAVTAVVRDPRRHPDLATDGIHVVAGDAHDPLSVSTHVSAGGAIVSAVTPFSAPPTSIDGFDGGFYERAASALDTAATQSSASRLVIIGLFAALRLPDGTPVRHDSSLFPAHLRPFAAAHASGIDLLRASGESDWVVLAPPPQLLADVTVTGTYRMGDDRADPAGWDTPLSYTDLATAVLDQIDNPTRHRNVVAIYGV